ncbi:hypothetical protein [Stakelama saccharophila]|uniref:RNA methyltransferase n=1 Tax=Stakelama saccharophila TaxID=3075605 RepID=A0ABZ0B815_9SPHN|nr:hypothetical protein [Stakelama sp. W311]WNO52479.1 hypothetical protein RPR59_08295 [Stakelama sp. W311]
MRECHILTPDLFALVAPLRGLLDALLPKKGRADVQLTCVDQGVDVVLAGVSVAGLRSLEALTTFAERQKLARLCVDEGLGPEPRWEPRPVTITLSGVPVPFPAGGFLQATCEGEAALIAAAQAAVGQAGTIADLFAGLGTLTFGLGRRRIYAAEASREAIAGLKSAADAAGLQVFADHRDLYRRPLGSSELDRFDAAILDPPRAGAREQAATIARSTLPRLCYISCNPNTFARDAAIICEGGFRLEWVRPVGQFRWSTHVELAACFTRQSG